MSSVYSLIQICRNEERVNVGMVFYNPTTCELVQELKVDVTRLEHFWNTKPDETLKELSETLFRLNKSHFASSVLFSDWLNKQKGIVQFSPARKIPHNLSVPALLATYF